MRPLGIPTMKDRAMQAFYLAFLSLVTFSFLAEGCDTPQSAVIVAVAMGSIMGRA
jgi:hypothetical protein